MSFEVVTYANTSQGMFEELVHNEFNVPIKVLGWGTKWNGFSDKSKGVIEYLRTKRDDDIIVFVDGFDTKVHRAPDDLLDLFRECSCRVLLSKDPNITGSVITKHLFGTCRNDAVANAGMYMGYVKELRQVLVDEANSKCSDDQVNLNTLCKKYDFIRVDEDEKIFKNYSPINRNKETNAIFVSYPGSPSTQRYLRAIVEYTQFVYMYVLCLIVVGIATFPKYKNVLVPLLVGVVGFYSVRADKSCTI